MKTALPFIKENKQTRKKTKAKTKTTQNNDNNNAIARTTNQTKK